MPFAYHGAMVFKMVNINIIMDISLLNCLIFQFFDVCSDLIRTETRDYGWFE